MKIDDEQVSRLLKIEAREARREERERIIKMWEQLNKDEDESVLLTLNEFKEKLEKELITWLVNL